MWMGDVTKVPKGFSKFSSDLWSYKSEAVFSFAPSGVTGSPTTREGVRSYSRFGDIEFEDFKSRLEEKIPTIHVQSGAAAEKGRLASDFMELFSHRKFAKIVFRQSSGAPRFGALNFSGAKAKEATFQGSHINLNNCEFGVLNIDCWKSLRATNCKIGKLVLNSKGDKDVVPQVSFNFENCDILSLEVQDIDCVRTINFSNSSVSTKLETARLKEHNDLINDLLLDRKSFADLYRWAVNAGDSKTAHWARGRELAVEKLEADTQEKIILTLWGVFSLYGLSIWRPVFWLLGAVLASVLLLALCGAEVAVPERNLVGWREILLGSGFEYNLARAVVGSIEGLTAPFSVFSPRRLVVPDKAAVAVFQFFYGYFCLSMILLFGFAVRRRLRM